MSHTISATGKPFGLQRVCQVLDFPRSTIYAERARALNKVTPLCPCPTWPKAQGPRRPITSGSQLFAPI
ncbi:MAG: hypothetical protein VB137_05240 [Burkholderia sp.]